MALPDSTCPFVKNMLLLDSEGKRIAVKYFSEEWSTVVQQSNFEKSVFSKTSRLQARGEAEITLFDDVVVVYKNLGDLFFYVTGDQDENELILHTVLQAFYDSIALLLRGAVEKKTVLENLDLILLAMDEIVDRGLILETDPGTVAGRVAMRGDGIEAAGMPGGMSSGEQIFSQAFASAKEQLARSLLK